MDEEELEREHRRISRQLISDEEFNRILDELADEYFAIALERNPVTIPTRLICYEADSDGDRRKSVEIGIPTEVTFSEEYMNRLGKKIFDIGVAPVAIFIVGFGDFYMKKGGGEQEEGKGIIIGGITLDSRSAHAQIETAQGDTRLIPVNKHVFPYFDSPTQERFNYLMWVFDGYATLMKQGEISLSLANGFASIGLWKGTGNVQH